MLVLVDYNNIPEADRRKGVEYVVNRLISAIDPACIRGYRRIAFRLYDGWYEKQSLTRKAQTISANVQSAYPDKKTLCDKTGTFDAIVNVDLAYSLRCEPGVHIWHTFRQHQRANLNVKCQVPSAVGCTATTCALTHLPALFSSGACPIPGCQVTSEALFVRNEQKMVDTMIVADMLESLLKKQAELAVVSSDDDLWPAIRMLLANGMRVFHIHTIPKRTTPSYFLKGLNSNYVQLGF